MNGIDNIITEAINNQVSIGMVKGYRDGIARIVTSLGNNQQLMQDPVIANMQNYGMLIVNAYDKGNIGDIGDTNSPRNKMYYSGGYYGEGLGWRIANGILSDLGRAGYGQLTNPLQSSLYDFRRGYNIGKNWTNRHFGNNNTNQQQQKKVKPEKLNGNLMQLLNIRKEKYNEFHMRASGMQPRPRAMIYKMFNYINGMYNKLTGQHPPQSAAQMRAGYQARQNQNGRNRNTGTQAAGGTQNAGTPPVNRTP